MKGAALAVADREAAATRSMLSIRDVRVSYGESVVVDANGIEVPPGEIVCLMGRNGAGKTTLMKAIMGTLPLRGGSISLTGQDMRHWQPYKRARAGIGYVPQGRGIFPYLTVMENLLIGLEPLKGKDDASSSHGHACCSWMSQPKGSSPRSSSRSKKSSHHCAAKCPSCWSSSSSNSRCLWRTTAMSWSRGA
jgi:ABC-type Fe3+/spermidine/putrescine transport system ATPase subunit